MWCRWATLYNEVICENIFQFLTTPAVDDENEDSPSNSEIFAVPKVMTVSKNYGLIYFSYSSYCCINTLCSRQKKNSQMTSLNAFSSMKMDEFRNFTEVCS